MTDSGYAVDLVGSLEDGTFVEKQHEGHRGWRDDEIADYVYSFLNAHPAKIVLLHIGTNSLSTSPDDVEAILDEIDQWENDNSRTVIVILARIVNRQGHICPNPSTTTTFNNNVEDMALWRIHDGDRIVIVDMECGAGLDYDSDMYDLLHPDRTGYSKMAYHWSTEGLLSVLPWADAGADQRVDPKTVVALDGSGSDDPDGGSLQYDWEQLPQGPVVTLSDPAAQRPTFTAPEVGPDGESLTFRLTVTDDDGLSHSDTVDISIVNVLVPPAVDAGPDQEVTEGEAVTLDGSNSHDPDGKITSIQWEQVGGSAKVNLETPNSLKTAFTAPDVDADGDLLTFRLTIADNEGLVSEDSLYIRINPLPDAGTKDQPEVEVVSGGGSGGGGCFINAALQ
jgi:hypothetical protein